LVLMMIIVSTVAGFITGIAGFGASACQAFR
jgi:hypothetical protein